MCEDEYKITVKTSVSPEGVIRQKIFSGAEDQRMMALEKIINTQEDQIRNALISLGWTPPK